MGLNPQSACLQDGDFSEGSCPASTCASDVHLNSLIDEAFHIQTLADDGRISLNISENIVRRSNHFVHQVQTAINRKDNAEHRQAWQNPPRLNIVMQVVGSRGDVQPFIPLAQALCRAGHRVRLATHPVFRSFVEKQNIEFFSIGGDPAGLMAYMVKNPSLVPSIARFRPIELQGRRKMMRDIMQGCWKSCFEEDLAECSASSSNPRGARGFCEDARPFVADVIIANPPSMAHVHCAEKLGIPLHIVFTMPWTPTQEFPHPLAKIKSTESDAKGANYLSFFLLDAMIWQGLGGVINRFRYKVLGLEPIQFDQAPGLIHRLCIPHTYCWSPLLIPKPTDWEANITVSGSFPLPLASQYKPSEALQDFLKKGPPPIYVGFGSIVVEDPHNLTRIVFEAIKQASVRAIVSNGWSSLDTDSVFLSENVFILDDCPHDWLFPQVSCVVHHGGAGTTAAGLSAGKPIVIVPFFGDQPFWGNMVYRAGAGPRHVPFKSLKVDNLAQAIIDALQPEMRKNAEELKAKINSEDGLQVAVEHFHRNLPISSIQCSVAPELPAVWHHKLKNVKLSALAATVLRKEKLLDWDDMKLCHNLNYNVANGPWDPLSGALWAVGGLLYDALKGCGETCTEFFRVPFVGQTLWEKPISVPRVHVSSSRTAAIPSQVTPALDSVSVSKTASKQKTVGYYAAKGTWRIVKSSVRSPGAFCTGIASGAHNLPRLWGDRTVRPQEKITGFSSGVTEGCKELVLGVGDGIGGLVVQPLVGFAQDGFLGFAKGFGKGVVGLPVKFLAAASGVAGYPLKGLDMEVTKAIKGNNMKRVQSMRTAQGEIEYHKATESEKKDIIDCWHRVMEREKLWV